MYLRRGFEAYNTSTAKIARIGPRRTLPSATIFWFDAPDLEPPLGTALLPVALLPEPDVAEGPVGLR
jgi:hypothetical protein